MSRLTDKLSAEWQDAGNLLLGLWLAVSPWPLAYASERTPMINAVAVGVIIAVAAAGALYAFHAWEEWVNVALAAWLIASPWLLNFSTLQVATWNQIAVGTLVAILALWSTTADHSSGGLTLKG